MAQLSLTSGASNSGFVFGALHRQAVQPWQIRRPELLKHGHPFSSKLHLQHDDLNVDFLGCRTSMPSFFHQRSSFAALTAVACIGRTSCRRRSQTHQKGRYSVSAIVLKAIDVPNFLASAAAGLFLFHDVSATQAYEISNVATTVPVTQLVENVLSNADQSIRDAQLESAKVEEKKAAQEETELAKIEEAETKRAQKSNEELSQATERAAQAEELAKEATSEAVQASKELEISKERDGAEKVAEMEAEIASVKASSAAQKSSEEVKQAMERARIAKAEEEKADQELAEARKKAEEAEAAAPPRPGRVFQKELESSVKQVLESAKKPVGIILDRIAAVDIDKDTEDEYWVLGPFKMLRKETSAPAVIVSGLLAGVLVELSNALILHPLDTYKTRIQSAISEDLLNDSPDRHEEIDELNKQRLFDGIGPVLLTVPALSIFWAVKDIVRRNLVKYVTGLIPFPVISDVVATGLAAACGEAVYIAVKTPGELLKTKQQVEILQEESVEMTEVLTDTEVDNDGEASPTEATKKAEAIESAAEAVGVVKEEFQAEPPLWQASLRSYPMLAAVDVPQVSLRTAIFVFLHDSGGSMGGAGEDILLFTVASTAAAFMCTPLDVVRTQMLVQQIEVSQLPDVLFGIYRQEGLAGLMKGWQPRLLWNGICVGAVLGICRLQYSDARAFFLVQVLDRFEDSVQPLFSHWAS